VPRGSKEVLLSLCEFWRAFYAPATRGDRRSLPEGGALNELNIANRYSKLRLIKRLIGSLSSSSGVDHLNSPSLLLPYKMREHGNQRGL